MNDFKFNTHKKKIVDYSIKRYEVMQVISDFIKILGNLDESDFFQLEQIKKLSTNKEFIETFKKNRAIDLDKLIDFDVLNIDNSIIKEWENKEINGLSVLLIIKYVHYIFYLDHLAYKNTIGELITNEIDSNKEILATAEIKKRNSNAVNVRHNKTREQKNKLIEIWKSNRYKTKDACAEAEYKNLDFNNFRTARNALNNID